MDAEEPSLSEIVERFIALHSMSPATFGRLALRDPHFVRDLRAGRRLWPETDKKVRQFMVSYPAADDVASATALCPTCDRRAEDPVNASCSAPDCPQRVREAA